MTKFVIGGQEYEVGPVTFAQLKKIWSHVEKLAPDGKFETVGKGIAAGFGAIDSACAIMAELIPGKTAQDIEKVLLPKEVAAMSDGIQELMIESGLAARPQAQAAALETPASPGQVTGTPLSQSSSEQVVEDGTK